METPGYLTDPPVQEPPSSGWNTSTGRTGFRSRRPDLRGFLDSAMAASIWSKRVPVRFLLLAFDSPRRSLRIVRIAFARSRTTLGVRSIWSGMTVASSAKGTSGFAVNRGSTVAPVDQLGRDEQGDDQAELSVSVSGSPVGVPTELAVVARPRLGTLHHPAHPESNGLFLSGGGAGSRAELGVEIVQAATGELGGAVCFCSRVMCTPRGIYNLLGQGQSLCPLARVVALTG